MITLQLGAGAWGWHGHGVVQVMADARRAALNALWLGPRLVAFAWPPRSARHDAPGGPSHCGS